MAKFPRKRAPHQDLVRVEWSWPFFFSVCPAAIPVVRCAEKSYCRNQTTSGLGLFVKTEHFLLCRRQILQHFQHRDCKALKLIPLLSFHCHLPNSLHFYRTAIISTFHPLCQPGGLVTCLCVYVCHNIVQSKQTVDGGRKKFTINCIYTTFFKLQVYKLELYWHNYSKTKAVSGLIT